MPKKGQIYEELVYRLSKFIHKGATVTFDAKLPSKLTPGTRQIDVLIEVQNGPTTFRAIVEARERSRRVGVDFIEQAHSKGKAVGADKVIIVSNKGFVKNANQLAAAYNMQLFSLAEAMQADWSQTISQFDYINYDEIGTNLTIDFLGEDHRIIQVNQKIKEEVLKNKNAAVLAQNPKTGEKLLVSAVMKMALDGMKAREIVNLLEPEVKQLVRVKMLFPSKSGWQFKDAHGKTRDLIAFGIEGAIWRTVREVRLSVRQYRDASNGAILAEVIEPIEKLGFKFVIDAPDKDGTRNFGLMMD